MTTQARNLYLVMLISVLINSLIWLDSFENYLNIRYHLYLSEYLPESVFKPSKILRDVLAADDVTAPPAISSLRAQQPTLATSVAASELPVAESIQHTSDNADSQVSASVTVEQKSGLSDTIITIQQTTPDVALEEAPIQAVSISENFIPKVLFAGDSMMQGVAPRVISQMRKDFPKGVFVDASKPGTGLASKKYFDWPEKIRQESLKNDIQELVIFLGPNDPWDILEEKKRYAFPSESWKEKYRDRVDSVLDFARSQGIHVIWIGLPTMQDERINKGAKIENSIFQEEVQKYKFDYVATDDLLGSLDEPYTKYITDPKKGKLAVRQEDGVHFTHLGLRMISLRIDEHLRKREHQ
jgi:uncharacterized protein